MHHGGGSLGRARSPASLFPFLVRESPPLPAPALCPLRQCCHARSDTLLHCDCFHRGELLTLTLLPVGQK